MNWLEIVSLELQRGEEARRKGNDGRARTSARRAAGSAITELEKGFPEKHYGSDFMSQLRSFVRDPDVDQSVRDAAERLQARLSTDFESPSKDPIGDARIIIAFVVERLAQLL